MRSSSRLRRLSLPGLAAILVAGALIWAGATTLAPRPAEAQGTLTAPGGQSRVTAPGGLRGRAALRHRRPHKRHR